MTASYADFAVGDRVWCLAWVGVAFEIVAKDDEKEMIALQSLDGAPTFAEMDIVPETLWMLTHEQWDQVWYWPDRAGERFEEVFDRFVAGLAEGDVVPGYHAPDGISSLVLGMYVAPTPDRSMMFRIEALDEGMRQVRVHPVAAVSDGALDTAPRPELPSDQWLRSGPTVPLRLEMRLYRWCLCFGEFVLNWEDMVAPEG